MRIGDDQPLRSDRSNDANKIYDSYVKEAAKIDEEIHKINLTWNTLTPQEQVEATDKIAKLNELKLHKLFDTYRQAWSDPHATIEDFEEMLQGIDQDIDNIVNGNVDPGKKIHDDYEKSQKIIDELNGKIHADEQTINSLESQVDSLSAEIEKLREEVANSGNAKAKEDLAKAESALQKLQSKLSSLKDNLNSLKEIRDTAEANAAKIAEMEQSGSQDSEVADALLQEVEKNQTAFNQGDNNFSTLVSSTDKDIDAVGKAIEIVRNDLNGNVNEIKDDYEKAKKKADILNKELASDEKALTDLNQKFAAWEKTIADLEKKIQALPNGPEKDKAMKDLATAKGILAEIQGKISTLNKEVTALQTLAEKANQAVVELAKLAANPNPTEADKLAADKLLQNVQQFNTQFVNEQAAFNKAMPASSLLTSMTSAIAAIQNDLKPTPPNHGKIEHSVWYVDWTSHFGSGDENYIFNIPENVDSINIFVGYIDSSGKPGGFGGLDEAAIKRLIAQCHAHQPPIKVQISIGGHGALNPVLYDQCWRMLEGGNVDEMGKTLAKYCIEMGIDGVDFDFEDYYRQESGDTAGQASLEKLVGQYIKAFKLAGMEMGGGLDGTGLQATICTNAGSIWQKNMANILDAAKLDDGTSAIDRVYIMSYYEGIEQECKYIKSWVSFLEKYGISTEQMSFGIDDFDAHAYDPDVFAAIAEKLGFSWAWWAFDPERGDKGDTPDGSSDTTIQKAMDALGYDGPVEEFDAWLKDWWDNLRADGT